MWAYLLIPSGASIVAGLTAITAWYNFKVTSI